MYISLKGLHVASLGVAAAEHTASNRTTHNPSKGSACSTSKGTERLHAVPLEEHHTARLRGH